MCWIVLFVMKITLHITWLSTHCCSTTDNCLMTKANKNGTEPLYSNYLVKLIVICRLIMCSINTWRLSMTCFQIIQSSSIHINLSDLAMAILSKVSKKCWCVPMIMTFHGLPTFCWKSLCPVWSFQTQLPPIQWRHPTAAQNVHPNFRPPAVWS